MKLMNEHRLLHAPARGLLMMTRLARVIIIKFYITKTKVITEYLVMLYLGKTNNLTLKNKDFYRNLEMGHFLFVRPASMYGGYCTNNLTTNN